ncbi:hypothetical protein F4859DRAFT_473227 [Xylaria cf. heliscus]|nr:hypothetical protein F4859DRAFT_473227 [Xylaria cf. heliscus]
MIDPKPLEAGMYFLQRSSLYDAEKPYSLRFPAGESLAHTNVISERHLIQVRSMRDQGDLTLEKSGFEILPFTSPLTYKDFESADKIVHVLLPAFCQKLKKHFKAQHVVALDFSVRRRHKAFPVSTGDDYEYDQPTAMAHIDFTVDEGERLIRLMYPDQADKILEGGWKLINAWRPLRGPSNDWPLGICDARTINNETDTMPGDIVYEQWATENLQVHYSDTQQWYYLPDQTENEVLIFKSAEASPDKSQAVPHGSFYNPLVGSNEPPRESIDSRFFIFYAQLEQYPKVQGDPFSQRTS